MGVSEKVVKDPNIRALLDRREEIKNTINRLEAEYSAIGTLLTENYNLKNKIKNLETSKEEEER